MDQQLLRDLARALGVTAERGQQRVEELRLRMAGQDFLHLDQLPGGSPEIALANQHRDQRAVRQQRVGAQGQGLAVGGDRRCGVGIHLLQQVALEHPGLGIRRVPGQQVVCHCLCSGHIAACDLEPGPQQLRRQMPRQVLQRGGDGLLGVAKITVVRMGQRNLRLQPGIGQIVLQVDVAILLDQQLGLSHRQHGRCQQRYHLAVGIAVFAGAAKLGLGSSRATRAEKCLAQQEPPLRRLRPALQQRLHLDCGRDVVVLLDALARRGQQRRLVAAAATHRDQPRQ